MKIYAFSIDLKLDPETQGYKILEVNSLISSGFEGYRHATGQNMVSNVILPDYADAFPDHEILALNAPAVPQSGRPVILLPRGNSIGSFSSRSHMVVQSCAPWTTVNLDLNFINFCESKAFQSEVFSSDPQLEAIYPKTRLMTTFSTDMAQGYDWLHSLPEKIIVKPDEECGGNGVIILDREKAHTKLFNILKNRTGKKEPMWCGVADYVGLVQDLLPPNLIDIDGQNYDATMRVAVTVWQPEAGASYQCKIHDAYWKPSAVPYTGVHNRDERISYSAAYRPVEKAKSRFSSEFLSAVLFGKGLSWETKNKKDIEGVAVDGDIKAWLFKALKSSMPKLVETVVSRPLLHRVLEQLKSDDKVTRMMGISACLKAHSYPACIDAQNRDFMDMKYPDQLVEGIIEYIRDYYAIDQNAMQSLRTVTTKEAYSAIVCEDFENKVRRPIAETLFDETQAFMIRPILSVISRAIG